MSGASVYNALPIRRARRTCGVHGIGDWDISRAVRTADGFTTYASAEKEKESLAKNLVALLHDSGAGDTAADCKSWRARYSGDGVQCTGDSAL